MAEHVGILVARLNDVDTDVDNVSVSNDLLAHLKGNDKEIRMVARLRYNEIDGLLGEQRAGPRTNNIV